MFVFHCPSRKKTFRSHNLAAVWEGGNCKFSWGRDKSPQKRRLPGINTGSGSTALLTCRDFCVFRLVYWLRGTGVRHRLYEQSPWIHVFRTRTVTQFSSRAVNKALDVPIFSLHS